MEDWKLRLKFAGLFSIFYGIIFCGFVGWRVDHTIFLLLVVSLTMSHKYGYYVVLGFSGVIGWTILYDAMSFLPNYKVSTLHIKDLYDLEVRLFGIMDHGQLISVCEWFGSRTNDFLSIFCGTAYLLWIPAPMIYSVFLVWKNKSSSVMFAYAYLLTNVIGVIIYYLYPAAPPWYYLEYGNVMDTNVQGSEALLSEFDRITGTSIFHGIYAKSSNVFGAMPSLHASYPLISLLFAWKFRHRGFVIFFIIMCLGTWIGAVYSQHHYILDVLLGISCAFLSYFLMMVIVKTRPYTIIHRWYMSQFGEEMIEI